MAVKSLMFTEKNKLLKKNVAYPSLKHIEFNLLSETTARERRYQARHWDTEYKKET